MNRENDLIAKIKCKTSCQIDGIIQSKIEMGPVNRWNFSSITRIKKKMFMMLDEFNEIEKKN